MPDALFWIYTDNPPFRFRFSVVDYRALEADHPAFSGVAAYQSSRVTVTDGGHRRARHGEVGDRLVFSAARPGAAPRPAVRSVRRHPRRAAGGADARVLDAALRRAIPASLGRPMTIDGASYTIVGVLQERVGPLERHVALFTAARWPAPKRKGPFFTMASAGCGPACRRRRRSTRCGRPTRGCSRSGDRRIRTRRRRGASRI